MISESGVQAATIHRRPFSYGVRPDLRITRGPEYDDRMTNMPHSTRSDNARFDSTRWSVVLAAGARSSPEYVPLALSYRERF